MFKIADFCFIWIWNLKGRGVGVGVGWETGHGIFGFARFANEKIVLNDEAMKLNKHDKRNQMSADVLLRLDVKS